MELHHIQYSSLMCLSVFFLNLETTSFGSHANLNWYLPSYTSMHVALYIQRWCPWHAGHGAYTLSCFSSSEGLFQG